MTPSITNADIDRALGASEIVCVFQPRIHLQSGGLRGVESLARWQHPELGELKPNLFLPHVEQQGRMHEITARIIDCALETAAHYGHAGHSLRMHINLSAQDFAYPGISAAFAIRLRRHGLEAKSIRLELPERDLARLTRNGRARLSHLIELGFTLALQGLADKPVREDDALPIAEHQVSGIDLLGLADALQISGSGRLNGLMRAAKRMARTTTAIGLETPQDIELAKALGFDTGTGHALAAAMAAQDILDWIERRAPQANHGEQSPASRHA